MTSVIAGIIFIMIVGTCTRRCLKGDKKRDKYSTIIFESTSNRNSYYQADNLNNSILYSQPHHQQDTYSDADYQDDDYSDDQQQHHQHQQDHAEGDVIQPFYNNDTIINNDDNNDDEEEERV
eukprot:TRINITY_DN4918_c0_g1_i1.p1 TRINITY_DN4918_c0_g1~~TRINITY_DN4918_c0_g1_i1.p1  ORF type:complete len:122 (-),score=33.78 TRINITY_DN4918_c0_g1_i1:12-377(-)